MSSFRTPNTMGLAWFGTFRGGHPQGAPWGCPFREGLSASLAGWLAGLLGGWLAGWVAGWLAGWLLAGWTTGWLAGCLCGKPQGWQTGWLTGWLGGELAGWRVLLGYTLNTTAAKSPNTPFSSDTSNTPTALRTSKITNALNTMNTLRRPSKIQDANTKHPLLNYINLQANKLKSRLQKWHNKNKMEKMQFLGVRVENSLLSPRPHCTFCVCMCC